METFIDRGQLLKLAMPTVLSNGRRIPGLKLDHPRQLAVMHSLVRFANVAAGGQFTTVDLYAPALNALGRSQSEYSVIIPRQSRGLLVVSRSKRLFGVANAAPPNVGHLKVAPQSSSFICSRRRSSCSWLLM